MFRSKVLFRCCRMIYGCAPPKLPFARMSISASLPLSVPRFSLSELPAVLSCGRCQWCPTNSMRSPPFSRRAKVRCLAKCYRRNAIGRQEWGGHSASAADRPIMTKTATGKCSCFAAMRCGAVCVAQTKGRIRLSQEAELRSTLHPSRHLLIIAQPGNLP
jgi:hypothetical protein